MTYAIDPATGLPELPEGYSWYVGDMDIGYSGDKVTVCIVTATERESESYPSHYSSYGIINVERHVIPAVPGVPEHTVPVQRTRTRLLTGKPYITTESRVVPAMQGEPEKVWYTYTQLSIQMWCTVDSDAELTDERILAAAEKALGAWETAKVKHAENARRLKVRESKMGLYPPNSLNS